jgi:putative transposase
MARKPRILRKNASYHVVSNINRFETAFENDIFKEMFLTVLVQAKDKYKFFIRNFCIMPNHIHFIIQPTGNDKLPEIMRWILSVFAKRYNKVNNLKGHLFLDRYKSKIIEDILQFVNTFNYISNNPIKAKIVKSATSYKYGGFYFLINKIYDIIKPFELKLIL